MIMLTCLLGPSMIGLFTPNTSCVGLDFLEAELETGMWVHVSEGELSGGREGGK